MKNIVFILAGGTGSRVGGETPKQFLPLADGRSILEHSVDAFEMSHYIDEIIIVMHPDWMEEAKTIVKNNPWKNVKNVISGGKERWESSWNGISMYLKDDKKDMDTFYWFHDAARPFVSQDIISRVAEGLKNHLAVTVAVPVTDTLYKVESRKSKVSRHGRIICGHRRRRHSIILLLDRHICVRLKKERLQQRMMSEY